MGEDMGRPQEVHPVVAARIVSHTTDTDTDTKRTNYLGSAQTKYTWHDGRYARAHMDRGGADSCAFGRGGAESTTFDDRQPIPNGVIHVSYNLYACETTKARLYILCATFLRDTSAQGYVPEPLSLLAHRRVWGREYVDISPNCPRTAHIILF